MNEVTVKQETLLKELRANKKSHRGEFLKAQEGWKKIVLEELERRLSNARQGIDLSMSFHFPEPKDHTTDYDRVIRMVDMSIGKEITISEHDFSQFVMDDWEWKANWTASNVRYTT